MIPEDHGYTAAARVWSDLISAREQLIITNYVAVELCSVLQGRFGMDAVRLWTTLFLPALHVHHLDVTTHEASMASFLSANRRALSLVDCSSFIAMRELGVSRAFTLDHHFAEQGFDILPAPRRR
jgi:predicted nucleic acid-binding protein